MYTLSDFTLIIQKFTYFAVLRLTQHGRKPTQHYFQFIVILKYSRLKDFGKNSISNPYTYGSSRGLI